MWVGQYAHRIGQTKLKFGLLQLMRSAVSQDRIKLPSIVLRVQPEQVPSRYDLPDKYVLPKHLRFKRSLKKQMISLTALKSHNKYEPRQSSTNMARKLTELQELSSYFSKNYSKKVPKNRYVDHSHRKEKQLIQTARQRCQQLKQPQHIVAKLVNPEEQRLLEDFNKQIHLEKWGELGLIIKHHIEQNQKTHKAKKKASGRFNTQS